jgi:DNA polymerase epsilon subunit 1
MDSDESTTERRTKRINRNEEIDLKYGYVRHRTQTEKVGWLVNFQPTEFIDESKRFISAVDYYFISEDNQKFKATVPYNPYMFIGTKRGTERDVLAYLSRKYFGKIVKFEIIEKEDLDLKNHLIGLKQQYIKLTFLNTEDQTKVRRELMAVVKRNKEAEAKNAYETNFVHQDDHHNGNNHNKKSDQLENIIDIRYLLIQFQCLNVFITYFFIHQLKKRI